MHYHNMDAKNVLKKKLSQKSHRHPNNQQGTDNTSRGSGIQHVRIRAGLEGGVSFPHTMAAPQPALPTNMLLMNDQRSRSMSYTSALRSR